MSEAEYRVVVLPAKKSDGGGYVAFVPELQGCIGTGETREEALADVQAAIVEWLDEARSLNKKIPSPGDVVNPDKEQRKAMEKLIKAQEKLIDALQETLKHATSALEERTPSIEWMGVTRRRIVRHPQRRTAEVN